MAQAEVARILVEKRRQDSIAEEVAAEVIGIIGAIALCVAFEALVVAGVLVFGLTDASVDAGKNELVGVKRTFEEEMELLARAERGCLAVVDGVEVRNHSRHALFCFQLEFGGGTGFALLRSFFLRRRGCLLCAGGRRGGLLLIGRLGGTENVRGRAGDGVVQLRDGGIRQGDGIRSCSDKLLSGERSRESEACKECRNYKERHGLFRHDDGFTCLYFPIDGVPEIEIAQSNARNVSLPARNREWNSGRGMRRLC